MDSVLLDGPGAYHIPFVPDGRYDAMAAAFPATVRGLAYLLPDDGLRFGCARAAVTVQGGRARERADIVVCPPRPTGPPLLVTLPFLVAASITRSRDARRADRKQRKIREV